MVFRGDDEVGEAALDFSVSARARARETVQTSEGGRAASRREASAASNLAEARGSPREDGAARVTGGDGDAGARAFT